MGISRYVVHSSNRRPAFFLKGDFTFPYVCHCCGWTYKVVAGGIHSKIEEEEEKKDFFLRLISVVFNCITFTILHRIV